MKAGKYLLAAIDGTLRQLMALILQLAVDQQLWKKGRNIYVYFMYYLRKVRHLDCM